MPEAAPIHYVAERAGRMPPILSTLHALGTFVDLFKSRRRLEVENLFLSHQLGIALRRAPPRLRLCGSDWRCYAPLEIRLKRCEETGRFAAGHHAMIEGKRQRENAARCHFVSVHRHA